jgi:hypothetical protein
VARRCDADASEPCGRSLPGADSRRENDEAPKRGLQCRIFNVRLLAPIFQKESHQCRNEIRRRDG